MRALTHSRRMRVVRFSWCSRSPILAALLTGALIFLLGVVFLAFHVQRANIGSHKHFSVNVATESVLSFFDESGFDIATVRHLHRSNKSGKGQRGESSSTKKRSINRQSRGFWRVTGSNGIIVREHASLSSKVLRNLPTGSIILSDLTNFVNLSNNSGRGDSTRLYITYPLQGWVSIKTTLYGDKYTKIQRYLQPLQFMKVRKQTTDKRCSPNSKSFLQYTDLKGGDITTVGQPVNFPSAAECCEYCLSTEGCTAWTYTVEGSCWLKGHSVTKTISEENLISGFLKKKKKVVTEVAVNTFGGSERVSADCCSTDSETIVLTKNNASFTNSISSRGGESSFMASRQSSPHAVSVQRSHTDWTLQWPVGDGKFGALVGGTVNREVVPFSIGGLFVIQDEEDISLLLSEVTNAESAHDKTNEIEGQHRMKSQGQICNLKTNFLSRFFKKSSAVSLGASRRVGGNLIKGLISESSSVYEQAFQRSRNFLADRNVFEAEEAMKPMQQSGLGMFQYVADLTLIFSSKPIHVRTSDNQPRDQRQQEQDVLRRKIALANGQEVSSEMEEKRDTESLRSDGKPLIRGLRGQPGPNIPLFFPSDSMGRNQLLKNMADQLFTRKDGDEGLRSEEERRGETHLLGSEGGLEDGFGNVLLSEGILDMRNGVAHSFFIEEKFPKGSPHALKEGEGEGSDVGEVKEDSEKDSEAAPEQVDIETVRAHHRQWFVSSVDHVAVGVMSCSEVGAADVSGINSDGSGNETNRERNNGSSNSNTHSNKNSGEDPLHSSPSSSSCLNVAVRLTRDSGLRNSLPTSIKVEKIVEGIAFGRILETVGDEREGSRRDSFAMQLLLKSGNGLTVPNVVSCGVIRCISAFKSGAKDSSSSAPSYTGGSLAHISHTGSRQGAEVGKGKESGPGLVSVVMCNGASVLEIVTSVVESGDLKSTREGVGADPNEKSESSSDVIEKKILDLCWNRIASALPHGIEGLRSRHEGFFSGLMARTEISLGTANITQTCPAGSVTGRLKSFGAGCLRDDRAVPVTSGWDSGQKIAALLEEAADLTDGVPSIGGKGTDLGPALEQSFDVTLVSQMFMYGRYLLFSSAMHTPLNLQGIWTDGPSASWNGDYHLNVNMQQSYWAGDAVGATEVLHPLMEFIGDLSRSGARTARNTYGVKQGWVAHGFTDNRMGCGMIGEAQWSLCVTCGAWLALQGFDHMAYRFDRHVLLSVILPSLRGIALFFLEYLYEDPLTGHTHTGPTTSPENSYTYQSPSDSDPTVSAAVDRATIVTLQTRLAFLQENQNPQQAQSQGVPGNIPDSIPGADTLEGDAAEIASIRRDLLVIFTRLQMKAQQSNRKTAYLAFSPAIDISVLRQVASAFTISIEWAQDQRRTPRQGTGTGTGRDPGSAERTEEIQYSEGPEDVLLANAFLTAISRMPGQALPIVGESGRTLEYPAPLLTSYPAPDFGSDSKATPAANNVTRPLLHITEPDPGHRHWSALHWIHPGLFPPIGYGTGVGVGVKDGSESSLLMRKKKSNVLSADAEGASNSYGVGVGVGASRGDVDGMYEGAKAFIRHRGESNGGHTGWSTAWEACLHARLRDGEGAMDALERLLLKYSAANLLTLHPPLSHGGSEDCQTCYEESPVSRESVSGVESKAAMGRGMVTEDEFKFQIDGNLGYLAAVSEMLLQSHLPGYLLLLPALPRALSEQGSVRSIRARGDLEVSFSWRGGAITSAVIQFNSNHPWLRGQTEDTHHPGFFRSKNPLNGTFKAEGFSGDKMRNSSTDGYERGAGVGGFQDGITSLTLSSPNRLRLLSTPPLTFNSGYAQNVDKKGSAVMCPTVEGSTSSMFHRGEKGQERSDLSGHWIAGTFLTSIKIPMRQQQKQDLPLSFYPCTVTLCAWGSADSACRSELQLLESHPHSQPIGSDASQDPDPDRVFLDME